jgi:hypothetical protein
MEIIYFPQVIAKVGMQAYKSNINFPMEQLIFRKPT